MLKVFTDFDGTITKLDVGDRLFERFGGPACLEYIKEYREGKISAVACFRRETAACGHVDRRALDRFLDGQEVDASFREFVDFCRERKIGHYVLSDGMDYYIKRIFEANGLADIPFFANHLELAQSDDAGKVSLVPHFPYQDETCDRCACCKRNHMLTMSADDDIIVYIGEGFSDRCPVRYADIVFAKDDLLRYCQAENISYFSYRSFSDVTTRLKSITSGKGPKIRKRRRAQLAAREVFLGG